MYARITGTGSYLPALALSNDDLVARGVDTSDAWVVERTGIRNRHIAAEGQSASDMALEASLKAIAAANIAASKIDLIVLATSTPDYIFPSTACLLQAKLGIGGAAAFDLQAVCSGFAYALTVADKFIRSGSHRCALVVGSEIFSRILDWNDRGTCVLFGDGAGAVVVQRTDSLEHAILSTKLHSDGRHAKLLHIEHGYGKVPPYAAEYRHQDRSIKMHGAEVFKLATRNMVDSATATLKEHGYTVKDVDFAIFHQANIRIIDHCLKTLDLPYEKTWINVDKYGNTSAATLPTALHEAWRAGKVKSGDLVLMATFGGGLTWGSTLIRL